MARRFAKVSEEEIKTTFFYPSDLVNTKTTIPLRVGEERWIYPPLFTSPSGDSCILSVSNIWKGTAFLHQGVTNYKDKDKDEIIYIPSTV